jgi:hypothetical protein
LSLSLFEKTPLFEALSRKNAQTVEVTSHNPLSLFDF